jgi:hypothetical protein
MGAEVPQFLVPAAEQPAEMEMLIPVKNVMMKIIQMAMAAVPPVRMNPSPAETALPSPVKNAESPD